MNSDLTMMKKKIYIWSMVLLTTLVVSCREESDAVHNYAINDDLTFEEAKKSYAGKFKLLWNALNQNYAIWDYERDLGVDWDAVYDEFLPKYEALDKRTDVTDDELKELLTQTVAPLHDGHFAAQMQNHQTGGFVFAIPSLLRAAQRDDYAVSNDFEPDLKAYFPTAQGGNGDIEAYLETNTTLGSHLGTFYKTNGLGYHWAKAEIKRIEQLPSPTDKDLYIKEGLNKFIKDFDLLVSLILENQISDKNVLDAYNQLSLAYQYLEIPGFYSINSGFLKSGINVKYALFRNKVAYFYLSGFNLTPYMTDEHTAFFPGADAHTKAVIKSVRDVWQEWFNTVQRLHASGELRGVIIDVRSNTGGMLNDYQYILGSLLPSGGIEPGLARFKRGLGRYDFSPLTSAYFQTLETPHAAITEPIVVLCNCRSVSMSEMTSLGCKSIPTAPSSARTPMAVSAACMAIRQPIALTMPVSLACKTKRPYFSTFLRWLRCLRKGRFSRVSVLRLTSPQNSTQPSSPQRVVTRSWSAPMSS